MLKCTSWEETNMKRITFEVDQWLHSAVKAEASRHGKSIKEFVIALLKLEIQELECANENKKKKQVVQSH
jgi:hypothetical protein